MEKYTEVFYWGSDTCGQLGIGNRSIGKTYPSPKCCSFCIPISKLSCGDEHAGFIASNGYVYMMGSNKQGRLGINNESLAYSPRPLIIDSLSSYQIADLSCGYSHTGCLTTSGLVFTWGNGAHGALGYNESDCSHIPRKVTLNSAVSKISCGGRHTATVSEDFQLTVWGANEAGQLGIGNRTAQTYPSVTSLTNVGMVSCGASHTLVLLKTCEVLACGANNSGQLGIGNKENSTSFAQVLGLKGKMVTRVAAGYHSACSLWNGEVYIWGTGIFGEFLVPNKANCIGKITEIEVGNGYTVGIDRNGAVWTWGMNNSGCLGTGDLEARPDPYSVTELKGKTVKQVSCGSNFVMALGKDLDVNKSQVSQSKNSDLASVLSEMKKEIQRLHKGTGGLEEMSSKLEQSKIKQNYIQGLLDEEIRVNEKLRNGLKDLQNEKKDLADELKIIETENLELKQIVEELQSEVEKKNIEIERKIIANKKEDSGKLLEKIRELEESLNNKEKKIEVNENNSQDGKDLPGLLRKIQLLEFEISELSSELSKKDRETEKNTEKTRSLQIKNSQLLEEIKNLQEKTGSAKTENSENINFFSELQTEKAKNKTLSFQLSALQAKLDSHETLTFEKHENYSKEVSVLSEQIKTLTEELGYYKEINSDQERLIKAYQKDIKSLQEDFDQSKARIFKLESELNSQSLINKEFVSELTKQVASRAQSFKSISQSIPKSRKTYTQEDEIDLLYAKP